MKAVETFDTTSARAAHKLNDIRLAQAELARGYKHRISPTDKKLLQDIADIFGTYNPALHIVGVKGTHDHKTGYKDKQSKTLAYVAGNQVRDPKKFNPAAVCGGGLHSSFGHDAASMKSTLAAKTEVGHRYHIVLHPVAQTTVVGNDKLKSPQVDVVFTGSFKDCHRLLNTLFGGLGLATTIVK